MAAKTKIDRDEIRRLVEDGWTIRAIAEHFSCHATSISRVRAQLGIAHKHLGRPMTPERLETIAAMIADGWSHEEIHRTEGADHKTIAKYFPGTAWTREQRNEHLSALRIINPHFNRRPGTYDKRKYQAA